MLYYLLQVFLLQIIFISFYKLFLNKETFFQWNRMYLLTTIIVSFVLPIVNFSLPIDNKSSFTETLKPIIIGSHQLKKQADMWQVNNLWIYLYLSVVLILFAKFIFKLFQVYKLTKTNQNIYDNETKIVLIPNLQNAFTFFNTIYIDKDIFDNQQNDVLTHELVHVKHKHWIDLFLIEILKIAFWINPILYMYQHSLKTVHEYIADHILLQKISIKAYYNSLLQHTFKTQKISFANEFYKSSLIKKRIKMQKRKPSKKTAKLKYIAFIAILTGLSFINNACQKDTVKDETLENVTVTTNNVEGNEDVSIACKFIKKGPIYPGCEKPDAKAQKECTIKKIREFISENFNKDVVEKSKLTKPRVRILTQFTIDKNGSVTDIKSRSKYKAFEKEAKRIIALLPTMKPGRQNDKAVSVTYALPIIFQIEK